MIESKFVKLRNRGPVTVMFSMAVILTVFFLLNANSQSKEKKVANTNPLTAAEKHVIIDKGTETPFTGSYYLNKAEGIYTCKQCDTPLYLSKHKFDSGCGWPSFDDELPGAVERSQDADGQRVEITCNNCSGHLGHIFTGEGYSEKNVRHCVNSISLNFIPIEKTERAIFASGCFWGVEYHFKRSRGVLLTRAGYTGGQAANPTYEEVCSGKTGHAEAIEVVYNPALISYEALAKLFFETHDPTQVNRQGPDIGNQYRTEIFYLNDKQKETANKLMKILREKGLKVATQTSRASIFWEAEDYHQNYYEKNNGSPYCHLYTKRF